MLERDGLIVRQGRLGAPRVPSRYRSIPSMSKLRAAAAFWRASARVMRLLSGLTLTGPSPILRGTPAR
jgi:hypothetical protein